MDRCTASNQTGRCWLKQGHAGSHLVDGCNHSANATAERICARRGDSLVTSGSILRERLDRMGEMKINDLFFEWSRK